MLTSFKQLLVAILAVSLCLASSFAYAQSGGSSDRLAARCWILTGAVVPNATVEIHNPVSHFDRSTTTDKSGNFSIPNVPFNPYHMTVTATGFAQTAQDVEVRSVVPVSVKVEPPSVGGQPRR